MILSSLTSVGVASLTNVGYVLASTLVTTPKSSVHSNVVSHGLLLPLDDAKAGCSLLRQYRC